MQNLVKTEQKMVGWEPSRTPALQLMYFHQLSRIVDKSSNSQVNDHSSIVANIVDKILLLLRWPVHILTNRVNDAAF